MRYALPIIGISMLTACAAVPVDKTLSYGCSDTVVLGTVADNVFGPAGSTGNLLGNGWISATLHVRQVVKGEQLPALLPVRYFAPAAIQRNDELMLVLKNTASGYEIQDGEFMREQPTLASRCV
jgi:hypothetical protein